jgi:allantoin racemase
LSSIEDGPATLLSEASGREAKPFILKCVEELVDVDAIIVSCFCDPGLDEARAIASVPVIGVGESSMFFATQYGHKFAIATVVDTSYMESIVEQKGFGGSLASVRPISVHPHDLQRERETVIAEITSEMRDAAETEGAGIVLLGCCGLTGFKHDVEAATGLPTLDPKRVAMATAEAAVTLAALATPERKAPLSITPFASSR